MSTAILKNALKTYIDQFDPNRIYLIESEVHPYLAPTKEQMDEILKQYQENDLSTYIKLNDTIKNAIKRSRKFREEFEQNPTALFAGSKAFKSSDFDNRRDIDDRRFFPKTEQ